MRGVLGGLVALGLALAACGDDGRDLAQPTTTDSFLLPEDPDDSDGVGDHEVLTLALTSPAFDQGGLLDTTHTCHGDNVAPPLTISGVPPAAVELAVTMVDDADGAVHWVIAGLPATTTELDGRAIPDHAVFATADDGVAGWSGPCPPPDGDPHTYVFTLYAFAEPLGLEPGLDGRAAVEVIGQTAMDTAALTAFFPAPTG